jgi:hypothetical protein
MLIKSKTLQGFTLDCRDGGIGMAKDFYFDDRHWAIRYLVAETGNWLHGRQVLISPFALGEVHSAHRKIAVDLTKQQIERSPSISDHVPVSLQFERDYSGYFGWPVYWGTPMMWGYYPDIQRSKTAMRVAAHEDHQWDHHLRSARVVRGYHLHAADGDLGQVEDFLIDDETWAIRYLIINTANWWTGRKILIAPGWVTRVSWSEETVFINTTRGTVKASPEYAGEDLLSLDDEIALHSHYRRHGLGEEATVNASTVH